MNIDAFNVFRTSLAGLERHNRLRRLVSAHGIDFTSNDYLGFARSPRLKMAVVAAIERGVPVGAGGSRLLRGNHAEHEALEAEAAAFFKAEKVLYFSTGYAANSALFSTVPQRGDLIVYDRLIHASTREGIAASKAKAISVAHNDVEGFTAVLTQWRQAGGVGRPWIVVESLYSMDGDRAPLAEFAKIADRHEGFLVIDEAHATGVYGKGGRGLAAGLAGRENVLVLHTCGKALGVSGALLTAPAIIIDYLVNRARSFIYSTAPSPLAAAALREALHMVADEPERREQLELRSRLTAELLCSSLGVKPSGSQILPVIVGDNGRALRIAEHMQRQGFDIRAIRPPTVPEGTARLRISVTLNVDEDQITAMSSALGRAFAECNT